MTTPVFEQTDFQGFADDGVPGSATSKAAANTGWTQNVDENFRIRFAVEETAGKSQNNVQVTFQYNLNGTGWNLITASTPIQTASTTHYADEDADNVQRVSTGTFTGGVLNEDDQAGASNQIDYLGNDIWETESCFTIDSAQVADTDTIQVRCLYEAATLDFYTSVPTITVSEATVITGTVNQVTETDLAQPVTQNPKIKVVGQVTETEVAQPITAPLSASVTFSIWDGAAWVDVAANKIVFSGDAVNLAVAIAVGEWQDGTYVGSDDPGSEVEQANNVKYVSDTEMSVNGGATENINDTNLTEQECTLRIRFTPPASASVANARLYVFDGTTTTVRASGVEVYAFERGVGATAWTQINDASQGLGGDNSGERLLLEDRTAATEHIWYVAISVSPEIVGSWSNFELGFELTYS